MTASAVVAVLWGAFAGLRHELTDGWALVPQTALAFWISLVAHEGAHLWAAPRPARLAQGWRVEGGWASVHVVGPDSAVTSIAVMAGPVAGALACVVLGLLGFPGTVCALLAGVHLVNLTSWCPDGRLLAALAVRSREAAPTRKEPVR